MVEVKLKSQNHAKNPPPFALLASSFTLQAKRGCKYKAWGPPQGFVIHQLIVYAYLDLAWTSAGCE
eukprot:5621520-Pleurochrysis_carterae.AAC.1